jgi:hypothetical protein
MNANELIARYAHDVARRLPQGMRADVEAELRALLEDELAERNGNGASSEENVRKLLTDFGPPPKVALSYHAPTPVIDPRDTRMFGKIIAVSLTALIILALSVALSEPGADVDPAIRERITQDASNLGLQILGALLIVFWIIGVVRRNTASDKWSPKSLPAVDDPDAVNRPLIIGSVIFWSLGLAVLAIGPERIIAMVMGDAAPQPLLDAFAYDEAFLANRAVLLWSLLAVAIGIELWQALAGRRSRAMRIVEAIFGLALASALFQIVIAGDVFAAEPTNQYMKLAMALFGGWGLIESGSALKRMWRERRDYPVAQQRGIA